ncbi:MAG: YIP1 family protein [Alistipes sp.]|nr:YIP1 family protein [Alistipes sp.]
MKEKIINPFKYLSMRNALCWGIVALILASVFYWLNGLRPTSLTQLDFGGSRLWIATARLTAAWAIYAVIMYVVGAFASNSKVRFGDVVAFSMFARIPFYVSVLVFAIPSVKSVFALAMDGNINAMMQHMNVLMAVSVVELLLLVWSLFWEYKAFAEATNVKNGKGVGCFIAVFILAYVATGYLLRYIG